MSSDVLRPRESGKFIASKAKHVKILEDGIDKLAEKIVGVVEGDKKEISVDRWALHKLLPQGRDEAALNWVFVSDVLNFSFWCGEDEKYVVEYRGEEWTGYWSLCAALCRAVDEGYIITDASVMSSMDENTFHHIFRSSTPFQLPMMGQRLQCLREAGHVLLQKFGGKFSNVIREANGSGVRLMSMVAENFESFRDVVEYEGKKLGIYKRAQIVVGDVWACMGGMSPCDFKDIHLITAFADYRVPQALAWLGVLQYDGALMEILKKDTILAYGEDKEVEIRGCTIHAVELLVKRVQEKMEGRDGFKGVKVNSIMMDHYLWDLRRSQDARMKGIPFHRVRCIYY